MILLKLAELIIIYIAILSTVKLTTSSTNYHWPQRKLIQYQQQAEQQAPRPHRQSHPAASTSPSSSLADQQHDVRTSSAGSQQQSPVLPGRGPLMIGQHYNNFSSIVPYSVVQDSDYNSPNDQLVQEEEEQQRRLEEQQLSGAAGFGEQPEANALLLKQRQHPFGPSLEASRSDREEQQADTRALLPLDSNRLKLPQMQQIKSRFNQGCVGGTKCQFFAFCWMSGGSLGASCGLLMTCCVTPSRQEIQPGFYGPVVNDPCKYKPDCLHRNSRAREISGLAKLAGSPRKRVTCLDTHPLNYYQQLTKSYPSHRNHNRKRNGSYII